MEWQGWFTLVVVGLVFAAMLRGLQTPDMTLLAGAVVLAVAGVISPEQLVRGFSNPGMLTIAALFVVAAALRETGALDGVGRVVLRRSRGPLTALLRLCPPVAAMSAFLNNTAVVAMMVPVVNDWCRRHRISPSRMLMPLSFAAVLGGTCTLIGTSTNLIVNGLITQATPADAKPAPGMQGIGFFEVAWVGVPAVVVGLAYLILFGRLLLPNRQDLLEDIGSAARQYLVNMRVAENSPLVGQRVKQAGLRHLPGLFLIEVTRAGRVIAPVTPNLVLQGDDRLTFTGLRSTIVDLERFPGLERLEPQSDQPALPETGERYYCEAVVSSTSPLIGRSVRDSNFRALYNAVVVAVHRGGAHLSGKVGDMVLNAGDTLLLQTGPHFREAHANNPDFYLVSGVRDGRPVRREKTWLSVTLLAVLVLLMATGLTSVVVAALLVGGLMVIARCISAADARRGVQWNVLLAIASALAIGEALTSSGAAHAIAELVVDATRDFGPLAVLIAIYVIAVVFTEMLTNSAAAVLVFPLALSAAAELGLNPRPFIMAVVFGASFGFATPIGYQTNLMVYGPGGYRFRDFLRVGLPLNVLMGLLAVTMIPQVWPLQAEG